MMTILTVKRRGDVTRITIGCPDAAAATAEALKSKGYMVKSKTSTQPVPRTDEERARAVQLITEVA